MGVVDETVEHGVGNGRIGHTLDAPTSTKAPRFKVIEGGAP